MSNNAKNNIKSKVLNIAECLLLLLVPVMLCVCAYFQFENTALITIVTVICSLLPFFFKFEKELPAPKDFMPVVILAAIACAGRIIFAPFPNFKPVSAIVILSGAYFGKEKGFLTGSLAALASNMFFGQGAWTPWQMYAWGLIGFISGTLQSKNLLDKPFVLYSYGFFSAFLYGFLLDAWHIVGFITPFSVEAALLAFGAGIPFSLSQAVATVLFLIPIYKPWGKKIKRIQTKYGV